MSAMLRTFYSTRRRVAVTVMVLTALVVAVVAVPLADWARQQWFADEPEPGVKLAFTATAYCKGTTTASGINVRRGIAAADPQVLPAGSVVSLSTGHEDFDGVYTVMDTGPRVKGRLLDLYVWSCHEALAFGRKLVQLEVLRLGWDPRASAASLVDRLFRRQTARRQPRPEEESPDAVPAAAETPPADSSAPAPPEDADAPTAAPTDDQPLHHPAAPAETVPAAPAPAVESLD